MADKTINDLTRASTLAAGDLFEIENTGNNSRSITAQNAAKALQNLAFRGALVKKSADQTAINATGIVTVAWNAESYDTDSFHDNATNNSRLTVPSGVSRVRIGFNLRLVNTTIGEGASAWITKNGSTDYDGHVQQTSDSFYTSRSLNAWSPVISVTAGDYFELNFQIQADTSVDIVAARSWFAIEVVG